MANAPPREFWRDPSEIKISMVATGRKIFRMETIEHDGTLWLVPDWYEMPSEGWMRPARMVSLKTVRHHVVDADDFQVVVEEPLPDDLQSPNAALETAKKTTVINLPPIFFSIPIVN